MRAWVAFSLILGLSLLGCSKSGSVKESVSRRPNEPPVTYVADDDPQMKAAIEKARATVSTFLRALQAPKPTQSGFSVKMEITDGKNTEHMWLLPVRYDGKQFIGTINNVPDTLTGIRLGEQKSVEPNKISDWMYLENRRLFGGYTLRVLRDKMPSQEREEFDKTLPFTIDNGAE